MATVAFNQCSLFRRKALQVGRSLPKADAFLIRPYRHGAGQPQFGSARKFTRFVWNQSTQTHQAPVKISQGIEIKPQHLIGAATLALCLGNSVVHNEDLKLDIYDCYDKELAGEGGYGKVWFVKLRSRNGKKFALKEVVFECEEDEVAAKNEVAIMKELRGPHFIELVADSVQTKCEGEQDGIAFLMEAAMGGDLCDALLNKRMSKADASRVFVQILEALEEMHISGMVHRDIKPENVLFSKPAQEGGRVKLADFGFTCTHRVDLESVERCSKLKGDPIAGTDAYMAPEILKAKSKPGRTWTDDDRQALVDPKVDMWATGVILHLLLTGQHPYNSRDTRNVFNFKLEQDRVPYRDDDDAVALVKQLLETNPEYRASAKDVLPRARAWAAKLQAT